MIIDTHSHLNFDAFDKDRDNVIRECFGKEVSMINVGSDFKTSQKAVEMIQDNVWAAVGLHPIHLRDERFDYNKYKELAQQDRVVAIGETGLDIFYVKDNIDEQLDLLKQHLELAKELDKAVILHCRMAYKEMIDFFKTNTELIPKRAVLHCFMSPEYLQDFLDLGFYIGYNGIIYKNIEGIDFKELIKKTPLDRIVLETDCPYLPPPNKKKEKNTPLGVLDVARTISEWRNEEITDICNKNAHQLFNI